MPTFEPYLTVRALQPVVGGLEVLGHPVARLLSAAGIERARLADADARIPAQAMAALWKEALALSGDEQLGIHLGEAAPLSSFEVHAYAMRSSPTLRDAY